MAAPPFVPIDPVDRPRAYESPEHIPDGWIPGRPAELVGRQPGGARLGYQGPDQGYGLLLAERFVERLQLATGERADDAQRGCLGVALRRASLFGRAPVIHDFTIAFTVWGYLDANAPSELVEQRRRMFAGVANVTHHYDEGRAIADQVPLATLRMTPAQVADAYPARWRELLGHES
jgi:hypothetical protein